jgi:hypothetical protein
LTAAGPATRSATTGKVTTGATISLDGFIADASHGSFDYLFKWYRGR